MALKDLETRQVARRELKGMLAGYLNGKAGRIDINAMGDYLFDRMARVPEAGCCRRRGDVPNPMDGPCACRINELEHEREGKGSPPSSLPCSLSESSGVR